MATISAVLYSNTQHPELKESYPNWNDRCKQILKKWRSLSTEKKAPFLQQAKDNRSTLRMRRTQQEQDRSNMQHKVLKEQEQERIWKLHQAKVKEVPASGLKNDTNKQDKLHENGFQSVNAIHTSVNLLNSSATQVVIQDNHQLNIPANCQTAPVENSTLQIQHTKICVDIEENTIDKFEKSGILKNFSLSHNVEKDNKQLRILLQRQNTESVTCKKTKHGSFTSSKQNASLKFTTATLQNENPSFNSLAKMCPVLNHTVGNGQEKQYEIAKHRLKGATKIPECPESTTVNELEKLDPESENAGFNDILGGLGEGDDDDLLKSLTAEIGDDFNILEYADPELDALANSQTLLSKLDFDDGANNN